MPSLLAPPLLFATTNIWQVFLRCDPVGQVITVMLILFSIFAWSVMLGKNSELKRMRHMNHLFEQRLREERKLLDLPESFRNKRSIPYADLFADAVESYWRAASIGKEKGEDSLAARLEHAENAIARALARQTLRYEENMVWLATMVTVAPFMGLLGTVLGFIQIFSALQMKTTIPTMQDLSGGVWQALICTAAGLAVSIPAYAAYNYLVSRVNAIVLDMEKAATEITNILADSNGRKGA